MVRVPDHPRARRSPYVFEHILVAVRVLGRFVEAGESVHHRNGVRDDNRPENLELWIKPQPSGIRVSDAIAAPSRGRSQPQHSNRVALCHFCVTGQSKSSAATP
jgi:hypothetical protein